VTRPAENQQTVEAALDLADGEKGHTGAGEPCPLCDALVDAHAALRDLVAQAARQEGALDEVESVIDCFVTGGLTDSEFLVELDRALALARLDGALQTKEQA
jgi:hypothetical protein